MEDDLVEEVARAWALRGPVRLAPASSGTQNQTYVVETPGETFYLRRYRNTSDMDRVRYEHAVLVALSERTLPFRVAAPLPARDGRTVVALGRELAALFPRLEGTRVDRTNLSHARACGVALGELHAALATIDPGPAPPGSATYGELEHIHALVTDPWSLPRTLPLEEAARERLANVMVRLRDCVPGLYAALPRQLCHNDYGPGNLLMDGDVVGAVLDFEFAAPDLRAIDVCTAWYWLALREPNDGSGAYDMDAGVIGAFLRGYAASDAPPLATAELDAMPVLARLRGTVSVIHREGRRRAGLDSEAAVLERVRLLLDLDGWLDAHGEEHAGGHRMRGLYSATA